MAVETDVVVAVGGNCRECHLILLHVVGCHLEVAEFCCHSLHCLALTEIHCHVFGV